MRGGSEHVHLVCVTFMMMRVRFRGQKQVKTSVNPGKYYSRLTNLTKKNLQQEKPRIAQFKYPAGKFMISN